MCDSVGLPYNTWDLCRIVQDLSLWPTESLAMVCGLWYLWYTGSLVVKRRLQGAWAS